MHTEKPRINPVLALIFGVLGMSLSSILVRFSSAPSLVTASWRMLWTIVILTPIVLLRYRSELLRLRLRNIAACAAGGLFLALHLLCYFEALKRTTVASATVLVSTDVIFTAIGFTFFLKGKIPKLGIGAIAITFAGAAMVGISSGGFGQGAFWGDLLAVLGALFASVYILIGRVQRARLTAGVTTWLTYLACALSLLLFDWGTGTPLTGWGLDNLLIGLLLAVFCTLLGHSVFNWCLKYLSPAYASAMKLGEPVFASLLAVLFFREIPAPLQIAGAIIILCGLFLFTRAERRAANTPPAHPPGSNFPK